MEERGVSLDSMVEDKESASRTMEPRSVQSDSHLDNLLIATSIELPWYKSLFKNIGEALNPPKLPPLELTSRPLDGSEMTDLGEDLEQPWFKSLIANVKDFINPPKLPPLEITSKSVEVQEIWGAYGDRQGRSGIFSVLIHAGVVLLLLFVFQTPIVQKKVKQVTDIYFPIQEFKPKLPKAAEKAGGGGGQKDVKPASHGEAPKFAKKQFVAPTMAIPKPQLPMVPTITADAPKIEADQYGDPLSKLNEGSLGNGTGTGIGPGNGNGYGPGNGGGMGGGAYRIGGEVSAPTLISKTEPEYSEEARKAKYSGSVLLSIVVDVNGLPRDIKVVRPLGLGLDEKAIEAVAKWRFRPGMKGGRAVPVQAQVEVSFRLL
jgi:TonB family protein